MTTPIPRSDHLAADPADNTRRLDRRDRIELLLDLAAHLPETDRLLVEQVFRHGLPAADVARLVGEPPRRVQRRLTRLVRRLRCPLYRYVTLHMELLPRPSHPVARLHILHGRSLRDTAAASDLTLHRVRQHLRTIRTLAGYTD